MLYCGVSHDGNGRASYLRERKKSGVPERYGMPLTETQSYGSHYHQPNITSNYVASHCCRKPIIQRSFYRTMGVTTYRDPPVSSDGR
mmetsp:Transcript_72100/g.139333  ORF Transcript_72100/g.139333 Transcript_72100/m.139333 type:complete len:87 (+) Transcript_72100:644-904(+)